MISVPFNLAKFEEVLGSKKLDQYQAQADKARKRAKEWALGQKHYEPFRVESRILAIVKPALRAIFHGKCAYCESNVDAAGHGDIETYRPKSRYPHLAFELTNLLYTCSICNQRYKRDNFPLESETQSRQKDRTGKYRDTPIIDISNEKPLLLNPYFDQPQEHLVFSEDENGSGVRVTGLTDRGRVTIDLLGLNRPELMEMRATTWRIALTIFDTLASSRIEKQLRAAAITQLQRFVADAGVYAGAIRQLCRQRFEATNLAERDKSLFNINELLQGTTIHISTQDKAAADQEHEIELAKMRSYSVEETAPDDALKFNYAAKRIDRIEIQNLRAIPYLDFTFPAMGERESWIVLIGENGVGKSTILQGVALALMGEERANAYGLEASTYVRNGQDAGFVKVHINSVGTITLHFEAGSDKFRVDPPEPKIPLLAYGPTRLLPSDTEHVPLTDRNIRTDNLFKATVPLSDAESWLAETWEADPEAFRNIGRALCQLLSISDRTLPRVEDGRVEIKMPDGWRRVSDLSAGYRSVLALLVDIAIGTSGKRRFVEDAVGIVLLDEIEVHLHPTWKIQIVERLRKVFPQLSFLVTTHDPLCLKGLYDREIVVLRRGRRGVISFATDLPSVDVLKTDDILTSKELFELPSSRNRTSPVTIARYSALLNKPTRTPNENSELTRLRRTIREMLSGALTPMQREVEHVVATVLSELRAGSSGRKLNDDVLAEVRRQVDEIGRPE